MCCKLKDVIRADKRLQSAGVGGMRSPKNEMLMFLPIFIYATEQKSFLNLITHATSSSTSTHFSTFQRKKENLSFGHLLFLSSSSCWICTLVKFPLFECGGVVVPKLTISLKFSTPDSISRDMTKLNIFQLVSLSLIS